VTQSEIVRGAEARAQTIIERAQREANDIRRGADGYAEQVLRVLDERVAHAQHQIRSGLIELTNRRGETSAGDEAESAAANPAEPAQKSAMQPVQSAVGSAAKSDSRA